MRGGLSGASQQGPLSLRERDRVRGVKEAVNSLPCGCSSLTPTLSRWEREKRPALLAGEEGERHA
jgi:hypothetical protein